MAKNLYPLYNNGKLDPQSEAILKQFSESDSEPLSALTPQKARECFLEESWLGKPEKSINIKKMNMPGSGDQIPIHIYTPEGKQLLPILIFLHGGGFVLGSLNEFDVLRDQVMLHDFVTLPGLFNRANDAINEICTILKKVFIE